MIAEASPETVRLSHLRLMLPGRIAVLVSTERNETIQIPDWVRAKARNLEIDPAILDLGTVVASNHRDYGEGDQVYLMPSDGLWINPNDTDIPSLGQDVPKGYQLRLLGANRMLATDSAPLKKS